MSKEIWILGATGRVGSEQAVRLCDDGSPVVLVGRDASKLNALAQRLRGAPRVLVARDLNETLGALRDGDPRVVVNTVGPFAQTAMPVLRACKPDAHYVDASNELDAVRAVLAFDAEAKEARRTVVTAAGFGVLGTEAVVTALCEGRPPPRSVRVDAVPVVSGSGAVGEALAASLLDSLALGGRAYVDGRLVRTRLGGGLARFTLPDGTSVRTLAGPSGDLEAAQRASGAPNVVAGNSEVPSGALARAVLPLLSAALRFDALRGWLTRRLARMEVTAPQNQRAFTWARATARWPDGTTREAWLRAPDGMVFTSNVMHEVVRRLARGDAPFGAFTPAACFGPALAVAAGAELTGDLRSV